MIKAYKCEWCGKEFQRLECKTKGRQHLFCSKACIAKYRSKKNNPDGYPKVEHPHLAELNRLLNPSRMTPETREKLRNARIGAGTGKTYTKYYGRHTHRVIAEEMLGRVLFPGEVVHHINGDKRDNRPENLMVFSSQAEHVRWHNQHGQKEVITDEIHAASVSDQSDKTDPK